MKKNILKPALIAGLILTTVTLPTFAQENNDYLTLYEGNEAAVSYLSDFSYTPESSDFSYLAEGTFILDGVFYNEVFGFSFRLPPLWENNFSIFQHQNSTIFMLNEGDFLFEIATFDINVDADIYHELPENFEDNYMILHQDGNRIFAVRVYNQADHSTVDAEYFATMQAPVNGIDDLFGLIDVQSINLDLAHENHIPIDEHIQNNFISDGTFYNNAFGFSFRLPPIWENNVDIFEHQNNTIFMLNEGDFLFQISVFDVNEEADIYHTLPGDFEENFIILHQNEDKIFAIRIYSQDENSSVDSEYFEMMQAPVNGIDDLFRLLEEVSELTPDAATFPEVTQADLSSIIGETAIINGVEMGSLAVTARNLGFDVAWDESTQTAEVSRDNRFLSIRVGESQYTNNFAVLYFDVAPVIHQDRIFVPVEFLALLTGM